MSKVAKIAKQLLDKGETKLAQEVLALKVAGSAQDEYWAAVNEFWNRHFEDMRTIFSSHGLTVPSNAKDILIDDMGMLGDRMIGKIIDSYQSGE